MTNIKTIYIVLATASFMLPLNDAKAALFVQFSESGSSLVVDISGSYTTWTPESPTESTVNSLSHEATAFGDFMNISIADSSVEVYTPSVSDSFIPGDNPFSSNFDLLTANISGDYVGFRYNTGLLTYYAPSGYVAGTPLSGSLTFANTSFEDVGLTPGSSGTIDLISDLGNGQDPVYNIDWQVAIPEPSSSILILCASVFFSIRRRHR